MGEVTTLTTRLVETSLGPDADVVALLEKYLEMARSGELRGLAVVTLRRGNISGTEWHLAQDAGRDSLIAAAGWLHIRMMRVAYDKDLAS